MISFINTKMYEIFNDFQKNIHLKQCICELKAFDFSGENLPDYSHSFIQQYYLLKYLPAYFTEYYDLYKETINKNFLRSKYNVLSIGCGCGLDFWGLNFAVKNFDEKSILHYDGIDIVNWNYKDSCNKSINILINDLNNIKVFPKQDYNIIIFPKSIGEFDEATFNHLKEILKESKFNNDKLVIISSLRAARVDSDMSKTEKVARILIDNHGYKNLNDLNKYTSWKNKDNGYPYRLHEVIPGLTYPDTIENFLSNLHKECRTYIENNDCCEDRCSTILSRKPISTMSQVKYQIIYLEKE